MEAQLNDIQIAEGRVDVTVTFRNCTCKMRFDKKALAEGRATVCCTYCKEYPKCGRILMSTFDATRQILLNQADSAILVIPDEDAEEMMNADWTGMI